MAILMLVKNIIARLYTVYALLLFFISTIFVWVYLHMIKFLLKGDQYNKALHKMYQSWMGVYMPAIGCPVKHIGWEHFEKGKNYVVVINHNSLLDIPVSAPGVPGPVRTLAKDSFAKVPFFGGIYKAGSILVNRNSVKSRHASLNKMKNVLAEGLHLCLYPEGTRNRTSELLGRFHDGAFRVALEAEKDIIPAVILGSNKILNSNKKFWAWPHRIEFHFMPAISAQGKEVKELKEETRKIMWDYLENRKDKL